MPTEVIQNSNPTPITNAVPDATVSTTALSQVATQPDLISQIFTQPYIWIAISLGIVAFVILKLKGKEKRPEVKPFYGVDVREGVTTKQVKRRDRILGLNFSYRLYKGMYKMGKSVTIEPIYRQQHGIEQEFYNIGFREFGIIAWIKYHLLGRYEHILLDPSVMQFDKVRQRIYINPKAYVINDSGIWTQSTLKDTGWINELNIKNDFENTQGFFSDWLRRMANQDVSTAIRTEISKHQADLEERAKANRIKRWES